MTRAQVRQVPHKKKNELEWCQDVGRKALITCCSEFSSAWPSDFPAQRGRGRPWLQRWCCSCALPHRARWTRDVHLSRLSWKTNQTSALRWGLMASQLWLLSPSTQKLYILFPTGSFQLQLSAFYGRKDPFILFLYRCPSSVRQSIPSPSSCQRLFCVTGKKIPDLHRVVEPWYSV